MSRYFGSITETEVMLKLCLHFVLQHKIQYYLLMIFFKAFVLNKKAALIHISRTYEMYQPMSVCLGFQYYRCTAPALCHSERAKSFFISLIANNCIQKIYTIMVYKCVILYCAMHIFDMYA